MDRTDRAIVDQTNKLARQFYSRLGYTVPEGYRFDEAKHPTEQACWTMACDAQIELTETDPEDALSAIDDEG